MFENERVELLRRFIVRTRPQKSRHAGAVQSLTQLLVLALVPKGCGSVRVQLPSGGRRRFGAGARCGRGAPGRIPGAAPGPSLPGNRSGQTSLKEDRAKAESNFRGNSRVLNTRTPCPQGLVEVYTDIVDGTYTRSHPSRRGQTLSPAAFPDVPVPRRGHPRSFAIGLRLRSLASHTRRRPPGAHLAPVVSGMVSVRSRQTPCEACPMQSGAAAVAMDSLVGEWPDIRPAALLVAIRSPTPRSSRSCAAVRRRGTRPVRGGRPAHRSSLPADRQRHVDAARHPRGRAETRR